MPDVRTLQKYLTSDMVKDGDIVTFIDAGQIVSNTFTKNGKSETNDVLELTVEVHGHRKLYTPNKTSEKSIKEAWGPMSEDWVGKTCKVLIASQLVFDKVVKVLILEAVK